MLDQPKAIACPQIVSSIPGSHWTGAEAQPGAVDATVTPMRAAFSSTRGGRRNLNRDINGRSDAATNPIVVVPQGIRPRGSTVSVGRDLVKCRQSRQSPETSRLPMAVVLGAQAW